MKTEPHGLVRTTSSPQGLVRGEQPLRKTLGTSCREVLLYYPLALTIIPLTQTYTVRVLDNL